jgi:hypothetical protein
MALRDAIQRVCFVMRSAATPSRIADASVQQGTTGAASTGTAEAEIRKHHEDPEQVLERDRGEDELGGARTVGDLVWGHDLCGDGAAAPGEEEPEAAVAPAVLVVPVRRVDEELETLERE